MLPAPSEVPPLTVAQVAAKMNRSDWWVRRYFSQVSGVLKFSGKRTYLLIPVEVFNREWRRVQIGSLTAKPDLQQGE
jgi:hypothetical protein